MKHVETELTHYKRLEKIGTELTKAVLAVQQLVDLQAEDDGLWFIAATAPESYLQAALRKLHAEVERVSALAREFQKAGGR